MVSPGSTGSVRSTVDSPSSVIECAASVWFEIVISTGPAPSFDGETR